MVLVVMNSFNIRVIFIKYKITSYFYRMDSFFLLELLYIYKEANAWY